jgi:hypothetical protein
MSEDEAVMTEAQSRAFESGGDARANGYRCCAPDGTDEFREYWYRGWRHTDETFMRIEEDHA